MVISGLLRRHSKAAATVAAVHLRALAHTQAQAATEAPVDRLFRPRRGGAVVLDGKRIAAAWTEELQHEVDDVRRHIKRPPGLAVILVGDRADSRLYVARKEEACRKVGIRADIHRLPATVQQAQLEAELRDVCSSPHIDGVLVQLPLPRHLDEEAVMEFLDPRKDVDGFHPLNMGRMLMRGRAPRFVPCTPVGCMQLLERSGIQVQGKTAVVLGDSNIVGTPLAVLLRDRGAAAVTVCHRLSYQEYFEDDRQVQNKRTAAEVCLPRLPGPISRAPAPLPSTSSPAPPSTSLHWRQQQQQLQRRPGLADGPDDQSDVRAQTADVALGQRFGGVPRQQAADGAAATSAATAPGWHEHQQATATAPGGWAPPPAGEANPAATTSYAAALGNPEASFQAYQLPEITRTADILIVAVGHPQLVKADWVKPSAVVIDVGINVIYDDSGGPEGEGSYHIVGDVAFEEVLGVASAITPVPGGVGPMTIAAVLSNTCSAARYNAGQPW